MHRTLPGLVNTQALVHATRAAVVLPGDMLTFTDLRVRADDVARGLIALGVEPGDRVGYLLPDGPLCLPTLFGILKTGAIVVPVNNRFKAFELARVLSSVRLRALLTAPPPTRAATDLPALLAEVLPSIEPIANLVMLAPDAPTGYLDGPGFAAAARDVGPQAVAQREARIDADAVALIKYTSGTTGSPKGAMLSHRALLGAASGAGLEHLLLTDTDVVWSALPLFHIGGVAFAVSCLCAGATFVHPGYFDPDVAVAQLVEHRPTVCMPAFETIWLPILNHARFAEVDRDRLRLQQVTGTRSMLEAFQARLPAAALVSCFGMTEACGFLSLSRPTDALDARLTTGGYPLPGMQACITNPDTGEPVAAGEPGEICFRGPNTFAGYYDDPDTNAAVFDDDGYFHSGDLGVMDADGRVTFLSRLKDMLKVGGENVAAAEVEDYLHTHPDIVLAQVVAAPDERYVEVPAAFVELRAGASLTEQALMDFCRGQIASFRVPRYVRFVSEWPMSGTKIKKFELRERIAAELQAAGIKQAPRITSGDRPPPIRQ
ncbi:MAG: AMP-binding protein [Pseudomonadota bacterium]